MGQQRQEGGVTSQTFDVSWQRPLASGCQTSKKKPLAPKTQFGDSDFVWGLVCGVWTGWLDHWRDRSFLQSDGATPDIVQYPATFL